MAVKGVPQPPRHKGGKTDPLEITRWFDAIWKYLENVVGVVWGTIDFTGSKLSDIESRPHSDLQGNEIVGVHPHAALTGLSDPDVHPHSALSGKNTAKQHSSEGLYFKAAEVTTTYTVASDDFLVLADASGGDFTITLPVISSVSLRMFDIKNVGSTGAVTVAGDGAELIDDAATFTLYPYETITIQNDDTNWWII